ncbi:hypothetical protein CXB51_032214 [Gossypium anomalum]|uniref:Uncharacterized protein n=1 Tax=Gossypium anomalum TaxID=47600 RepID=A0A8J5Y9H8_9ROSI|nr:hypothetical protein CXB51_032214 [Gossypium anomalum]
MIGSPKLSAAKEDKEHLTKNIDKCYNNFSYYQTQAGIDLMTTAQHVLLHQSYRLLTDGRRIVADETGIIQNDRDEESIQLLKKITNMEIDDFPSQLIEEIRNTWELWNSLRLSPDSLHLEETELMNLDNIQEG